MNQAAADRGDMKNATIATSRTRATETPLIDYRPLPAAWGDVEALREVRAARSRAARRGEDPSTLQVVLPQRPEERHEPTRRGRTRREHRPPWPRLASASFGK